MLLNTDNKFDLLDILIRLNIRFAIYRLPLSDELRFVLQESSSADKFYNLQDLSSKKGFVITPFQVNDSKPIICILPETELRGEEQIFSYLHSFVEGKEIGKTVDEKDVKETSKEGYASMFGSFIDGLKNQHLDKIVLSRTLSQSIDEGFSVGKSFHSALDKFPNSFVYLCYTPETGTWLGSTPEMLLSGKSDQWHTVALAGTKHISEAETSWDDKNKIEQKIVVNYVQEQLTKAGGRNIRKTEPNIIEAGNVVHLKSDFSFNLAEKSQVGNLLQLLHPTPAVCGYPKEVAYDYILTNELHDRRYYSGFVGYLDTDERTDLYVNLRCMEIRDKNLLLYAGGGILPSSELESEWKETENKLQTMLSIIQKK